MPYLPKKACPVPGCPEITTGGRCDRHKKQTRKPRKKTQFDRFYNSRNWQRVRAAYRRKHPLCEDCKDRGDTRPAVLVHHIIPLVLGGSARSWDNLRSLCNDCHERKPLCSYHLSYRQLVAFFALNILHMKTI